MQSIGQHTEKDVILDSITEGVFTIDSNWHITSFNKAAEEITGIPRERAVGLKCSDILRADVCETDCALRETMRTGKPIVNKAVHIVDAKGERHAIAISTALLKDENGNMIGGVETFRDMSLVEELRKKIEGSYCCEDIISRNHRMQELFKILPNISESDCTVVIEGDSGTGKELLARAIHNLSFRRGKAFVAVNCGALPETLLESELFGYKAGAFTDARKDKPGRFAAAEINGEDMKTPPIETALGALLSHVTGGAESSTFQPMNINFGLMPSFEKKIKKKERKAAYCTRALEAIGEYC